MKAHALLRVSDERQTISTQRGQIERWAAAQDPPREIDWREEPDTCSVGERPVLEALLRDARAGKVHEIVVVALDRLGRSLVHVITTLEELRALGVRVASLRESIDLGTPVGRFQAQVIVAFAELERSLIRDRTRARMQHFKARHEATGEWETKSKRPPHRPTVTLTEESSAKLRELVAQGWGPERIARDGGLEYRQLDGTRRAPSATTLRRLIAELGS